MFSHQREALSLGRFARTDPFPDALLAVGPFVPFGSENVQIGSNNTRENHKVDFVFITRSEPRRQCTVGMPHCPWFTKNRNNPWNPTEEKFNRGPNRPQNKNKSQ